MNPISYWRNQKKDYQYLGKTGKLMSFTKITNPPQGFGKMPYFVGIIKFANKKKLTVQLVIEGKEPKIGAKVRGVIRRIGEVGLSDLIYYGVKYKVI